MKTAIRCLFVTLLLNCATASAAGIDLQVKSDPANPPSPTMGDWMHFDSVITNTGKQPVEGLVAWISLVEVTPGKEQPMDLEDWSAHKAVTGTSLEPGQVLETRWPMRLIQSGDYRVVISVTGHTDKTVFTSPTLQFHVAQKPVVESARILPIAVGMPLLIGGLLGVRSWRRHGKND